MSTSTSTLSILAYLKTNIKFPQAEPGIAVLLDLGTELGAELGAELKTELSTKPSDRQSKSDTSKYMIEQRYNRLHKNTRRPSLEYISSEDILSIFLKFVEDKEALLKMSKIDLQNLYDKWYAQIYLSSSP